MVCSYDPWGYIMSTYSKKEEEKKKKEDIIYYKKNYLKVKLIFILPKKKCLPS